MKKYLSLALFTLMFLLVGCNEKANENEKNLKNEIETILSETDKALCFYLGDVEFPYTRKTLVYPIDPRSDVWVNNELNRRLELFSQLGLLNSSSDTTNQTVNYKLAELGTDTEFRNGSFCFGNVTLEQLVIHNNRKGTSVTASINYAIDHIPFWVNDETFTHYFYSQELEDTNENRYSVFKYSYPKLVNKQFPNNIKSEIVFAKRADGGLIMDDKDSVWQTFYRHQAIDKWDKKHLTYAYYDASLGTDLNQKSIRYDRLINTWGAEADPALLAKAPLSANLARSTNQVVMYHYFDQALTQNRIKSATGAVKNTLLGKLAEAENFEMYFDEDGLVSSFKSTVKMNNFKNQRTISRVVDSKAETMTWKFYDYFTASMPSRNQNHLNPFASDTYGKTDLYNIYQTNYTNKFSHQNDREAELIPVSVSYDEKDKILSFDNNMTFNYNDKNQLISRTIDGYRYVMEYDKQGRLTKMSKYSGSEKETSLECHFSAHNEKGDWISKSCNNREITSRTIDYYE